MCGYQFINSTGSKEAKKVLTLNLKHDGGLSRETCAIVRIAGVLT